MTRTESLVIPALSACDDPTSGKEASNPHGHSLDDRRIGWKQQVDQTYVVGYQRTLMRKSKKPMLAVRLANTAVADATKWQTLVQEVNQVMVDDSITGWNLLQQALDVATIPSNRRKKLRAWGDC